MHHVHPTDFTVQKQQLTEDGGEDILNGIPDWVYEEEMLGSKSASWFAPNGMYLIYLKSYTEGVERVRWNNNTLIISMIFLFLFLDLIITGKAMTTELGRTTFL